MKWALIAWLVPVVAFAQTADEETEGVTEKPTAESIESAVEAPRTESTESASEVESESSESVGEVGREKKPSPLPLSSGERDPEPVTEVSTSAPWSIGTARTLPKGRVEVGIFQPLRIGVTTSIELSTHALLDVLAPNLALKKAWTTLGDRWVLASRHSLWYPSGLLTLLAREGNGGILPEETRVPHIIMLNNEVLFSVPAFAHHTVTAKAGISLAATFGQSTLQSIDLPLVYPRLAAVFSPVSFVVGADLDGELPGPFAYTVDVDVFVNTDGAAPFAIEHAGLATWRATDEFVVQAGYKLIFGSYPGGPDGFRTQWHILPLVDLVWAWGQTPN